MRFSDNQNYNFRGVCHVLDKWSKIKCSLIILRYYHVNILLLILLLCFYYCWKRDTLFKKKYYFNVYRRFQKVQKIEEKYENENPERYKETRKVSYGNLKMYETQSIK